MAPPYTVCVLGAGAQGLRVLKNLLEESEDGKYFVPTLFESRDRIGGVWAYTDDPDVVTALPNTLGNVSRWRNCYGDFPVEKMDIEVDEGGQDAGRNIYLGQTGFLNYLQRYADAFDLTKWIRFNSSIVNIEREHGLGKWKVTIKAHTPGDASHVETQVFDKVVVATGQYRKAFTPQIASIEKFEGDILHSQNFKR